jgi:hypothetical protein
MPQQCQSILDNLDKRDCSEKTNKQPLNITCWLSVQGMATAALVALEANRICKILVQPNVRDIKNLFVNHVD